MVSLAVQALVWAVVDPASDPGMDSLAVHALVWLVVVAPSVPSTGTAGGAAGWTRRRRCWGWGGWRKSPGTLASQRLGVDYVSSW
jgi:hypothetical protein